MTPEEAALHFDVLADTAIVRPHGSGNVNDTYLAIAQSANGDTPFILQKLNGHVFRDPDAVMGNLRVVTEHVYRRLREEAAGADRLWQTPRIIRTQNGQDTLPNPNGGHWRALTLVGAASTLEAVKDAGHAREVGAVLGHFLRLISEIPCDRLRETIPGFHETPRYLRMLDKALSAPEGQARLEASDECRAGMAFVEARRDFCTVLEDALARGDLRLRPTHGDPKVANVMIDDATGQGVSMIDLDTVMPGLVQHDLGDCLRSACNALGEDAVDPEAVTFDLALCRAIVSGYLPQATAFLDEADYGYLYDGVRLMALELGIRFLADHLAGDVYFKVRHHGHNLHRARVQFALCASIEDREDAIREVLQAG